jgi:hypothetical protein
VERVLESLEKKVAKRVADKVEEQQGESVEMKAKYCRVWRR